MSKGRVWVSHLSFSVVPTGSQPIFMCYANGFIKLRAPYVEIDTLDFTVSHFFLAHGYLFTNNLPHRARYLFDVRHVSIRYYHFVIGSDNYLDYTAGY